jgi:PhnB protein
MNDHRSLPNQRVGQFESAVEAMLAHEPIMLAPDAEMGAMLNLASELRDLPRPEFLTRLKSELQNTVLESEGADMITAEAKQVRPGFRTVTPYLTSARMPEMADWIVRAFGGEEKYRVLAPGGGYHTEIKIGDTMLMVGGGGSYTGPGHQAALHLYVADVDAAVEKAVAEGATVVMAPRDQEYGDRDSTIKDPFGNEWYIATHKGGSHVRPGLGTVTPYLHPQGAEELIRFMQAAFGADPYEVDVVPEEGNRIVHAKVRIVDSVIEMGEAHGPWQNTPTMFMFYVDDCDAWYKRAVDAGAIPVSPPSDLPYGRVGVVADGWGNEYHLATPPKQQ